MRQVLKKIVTLIITLFIVSIATFVAFTIIPGDVVTAILGTDATEEMEIALRHQLGLDRPPVERYFSWLAGILTGNLGVSYRYIKSMNQNMPVAELIADKLPVTLYLALLAIIIVIVISIPLGLLWASSKWGWLDGLFQVFTQVSMAVPSFFLGILITYICGIVLKWFTPGGYVPYNKDLSAFLKYMIFPAIAVAIPKVAMSARYVKASVEAQKSSDYVRTARMKGATEGRIMFIHVLKNAMIPVVTFLGMIVAETLAGSIVVEQVFALPGIGRLLISSISSRDFPVLAVLMLYVTSVVIIVYFLVDVLYRLLDPRIRRE